jgi:hypothetical protein
MKKHLGHSLIPFLAMSAILESENEMHFQARAKEPRVNRCKPELTPKQKKGRNKSKRAKKARAQNK